MEESIIVPCSACGVKNRIPVARRNQQAKCGRCGAPLGVGQAGEVIELDDAGFDRLVGGSAQPVLVDFYSPTCGPCQMLAPVIRDLAAKYAGRIQVAKIDTSRFQQTASRFGIRGVPTLILFQNGQVVDQLVGAAPQAQIEQMLARVL